MCLHAGIALFQTEEYCFKKLGERFKDTFYFPSLCLWVMGLEFVQQAKKKKKKKNKFANICNTFFFLSFYLYMAEKALFLGYVFEVEILMDLHS